MTNARKNTRRCIATGALLDPETPALRLVLDPQGRPGFDIRGELPGRGAWVGANPADLKKALEKSNLSRAFRQDVSVPEDVEGFIASVCHHLERAVLARLGLAQRSGALVTGFEKTREALKGSQAALFVTACDGAADGRQKLCRVITAKGGDLPILGCFTGEELSRAMGVSNFIHGVIKKGKPAEAMAMEMARLGGFRVINPFSGE